MIDPVIGLISEEFVECESKVFTSSKELGIKEEEFKDEEKLWNKGFGKKWTSWIISLGVNWPANKTFTLNL